MRFQSAVPGTVTGVKFFKGWRNTGTHSGSIWTSDGRRLATATFANESRSGWQTVQFSSPVSVSAGQTYVASYHAPRGGYALDQNYFAKQRVVGNLSAPAGANGVYRYGSGGFPDQTYRSSNYYVDVMFSPSTAAAPSPSTSPTATPTTPTAAPSPVTSPAAPAPTVSPTVAPSPSASPTVAPASGVRYGWELTPSNTGLAGAGVDRNSLPVFTGTVTAGMTLSRVKITEVLDLYSVPNVTLDRVWLAPVGGVRAIWLGPGSVIKDSDVDGSSMVQGERIGIGTSTSGSYQILRTSITNVSVGTWLDGTGSGTMTETYVHNLISIDAAHKDGFTRRAGTGSLLIERSRLDASGPMTTGAFFLQNTWGDRISGITVRDTMLEGAGWVMTLENNGAGTSASFDNVRVRPFGGPGGTSYGPRVASGGVQYPLWNNVRIHDGTRLPGAEGAVLNP